MADPTEGWAERAAKGLAKRLNVATPGPLHFETLLPIFRQLEADEAALAINAHEAACHCDVICSTLTSLRELKRSLGVEE